MEIGNAIRIDPRHDEDIHLLQKTGSPGSVGVHLAEQRHGSLISRRLIAMDSSLNPHTKFCRVLGLIVRIAQESGKNWPTLFRLEVRDLVVEPVVAVCDVSQEVICLAVSFDYSLCS